MESYLLVLLGLFSQVLRQIVAVNARTFACPGPFHFSFFLVEVPVARSCLGIPQHLREGERVARNGPVVGANEMRLAANVVSEEVRQLTVRLIGDALTEGQDELLAAVLNRRGALLP